MQSSYVLEPNGVPLKFREVPNSLVEWRVGTILDKEPETIAMLDTLTPDDVLYDIGANIGTYSVYGALRSGCKVVAFEPEAKNFNELAHNVKLNGLSDRVTTVCAALSNHTTLSTLRVPHDKVGSAQNSFGEAGGQGCLGFTLDHFMALFNPPKPTALKIDVDGIEDLILEGAAKALSYVKWVLVEVQCRTNDGLFQANRIADYLRRANLNFYKKGKDQNLSVNVIWKRSLTA